MAILLDDIVKRLSLRVIGDLPKNITVTGIGSLTEAKDTQISFVSNPKYVKHLAETKACAVIMNYGALKQGLPPGIKFFILDADDPYLAFAKATQLFYQIKNQRPAGKAGTPSRVNPGKTAIKDFLKLGNVDKTALIGENTTLSPGSFVGEGATIGKNCNIMGNVFIGKNVSIGDGAIIYPNVTIYDDSIIGNNCIIHAGSVIGSDGFGYARGKNGYVKIIHLGRVILEDDVELGANVTVDRGAIDFTKIGKGTKIDNLVQIAHNVIIGDNCAIAAQTGIAGSSTIGNNVIIGGQAGIAGHIRVGNGVIIAAQSGVVHNIKDNETVSGYPAFPIKYWRSSAVLFKKLPELFKRIKDIEKDRVLKK
ncbi:MAG: UDP-3-O-(3-hydroxymyristoyl)glucosamine N-acyltransferase [Deltaproteobacteria bacterium]|nr:UDP-3-O-(3-hydroxymyristoyl)glucosamine N-acyltransferase [Deltaproteobacteria bacterium]